MGNAVATQSNTVNLPDGVHNVIRGGLVLGGNLIPDDDDERNIGAAGSEFKDLHLDGTANIDVLDVDNGANIAGGLVANSAQISDLTDNRVVIAGSSGELEDSGNLTFDGSTLAITGSIDLSADIDVDGTANLDVLDVDGDTNFGADVTFAGDAANIIFDKSADDLIFNDGAKAQFGTGSDLSIYHDQANTLNLIDAVNGNLRLRVNSTETAIQCKANNAVELYYDASKKLETTSGGVNITGITTISDRLQVTSGISTFYDTTQSTSATTGAVVLDGGLGVAKNVNIGGNLTVTGTTTLNGGTVTLGDADTDNVVFSADVDSSITPDDDDTYDLGSATKEWRDLHIDGIAHLDNVEAGIGTFSSNLLVSGISTFSGNVNVNSGSDVTLTASIGAGSSTILFDSSAGNVTFQDNLSAKFGTGGDLAIHHDGSNSHILNSTGTLNIKSDTLRLTDASLAHLYLKGLTDAQVELYHNNNLRISTTDDGADFGGTGSIRVPNGTTGQRNSSPAAGDFRYNTTTGKFEGYTDEWGDIGGSGGVEETSTSVSTTSATSTGSFAKASFRSASIIAQITQGSAYQVGRYLLIHDGTTVTTIEESAVATGSMLGTFEGVINGSNVEFRVTMSSSSSATVTTKIDTISIP